jgi:GntR family transcriptional regulator, transcriptional repressor for pyruvate dehydrogenase complex
VNQPANSSNIGQRWTREDLTRVVETEYLDGAQPQGTPLPSERVLCERFGVSRPFVREVLRGLQQRGRIDIVPGRGAFVRDPGMFDLARSMHETRRIRNATPRDLIEARATLERQTVALAAERATPADLRAIERALTGFDEATHLLDRARADIAFHALIARASGNPVLDTMFGSITTLVFEVMIRSLNDPNIARRGIPYHLQIMQALRDKSPEAAVAAMSDHIHLAEHTYGPDLDESLDLIARNVLRKTYGRDIRVEEVVQAALEEFAGEPDGGAQQ